MSHIEKWAAEQLHQAKIDRMAQELLDKIKREVEARPFRFTSWVDVLIFGLMITAVLISIAGCLRSVFRF